jgi:hypothetical protein
LITRIVAASLLIAVSAWRASAQTTVQSTSPTLAEMLQNIYGPHGLIVDSEAVLPDGSTHSAHFNGAFQSEFGRINIALVPDGALPIPSPASGSPTLRQFHRAPLWIDPELSRSGRPRRTSAAAVRRPVTASSSFRSDLRRPPGHIPAVFTRRLRMGGGRADVITTAMRSTRRSRPTFLHLRRVRHFDISFGVPLIRTR